MLENTLYRLVHDKKCVLGYFGGSITEGAGASSPSTCYRALVTEWFRSRYPDAEIREIQAAIGGTGSDLGMYREELDLLSKEPDLVFLEFAVNDGGVPYERILRQGETILKKLYAHNPYTEVVILLTTTGSVCALLEKGGEYVSRSAYFTLAHHYAIPAIDVGAPLHYAVIRAGGDFHTYTTDTVHPNDAGYAIYTKTITEQLTKWLDETTVPDMPAKAVLPEPLCPMLDLDARMIDCGALDGLTTVGFAMVEETRCGRYPRYFASAKPGDSFSFTFTGKSAGFYWMLAKDAGDVVVTVDDGEAMPLRAWDHYCKAFNRAGPSFFAHDLPYGTHTVTVKISDDKAEESEGHAIRIGCILVS